jgi:ABC-type nitrate/sulfonate/bicarbonate transport system substrate-binding protein
VDNSQSRWRLAFVGMLVAALAATAFAACGDDGDDTTSAEDGASGEPVELTLATPAPNSLFTFNDLIARELGFYEEEGLEVKPEEVSDEIPVAGLIQNGNADVGLVAAVDAITAASKTSDLRLPYDERTGGNGFIVGIVVPEESEIKSVADLEGQNVGLASPDQDRAFLASVLETEGMTLDQVETTVVGPGGPAVAQSLESGDIAAYTGTLQDFFAFDEAGLEVRDITPEDLEGLPVGGYIVRAADLEESDALIGFFRALAIGTYIGIERPEVAEAVSRQVAPEEWREPELAGELLAGLSETLVPFDGENFGEVLPERWENAQQIMIDAGVLESPADLNEFLVTDLLEQINDFDREAVLAQADEWLADNGGK